MDKIKIVTVDNDSVFLFIMQEYLNKYNYNDLQISTDYYSKAGLLIDNLEKGYHADIILLDINMPFMNGFDFLDIYMTKGLHEKYPQTKIYILTSSLNETDKNLATKYPPVAKFIHKTSDNKMIIEIIEHFKNSNELIG